MCAITETWLNDDISDCELLPDEFTIYRKDRSSTNRGKRGGGVLLAIRKNIYSHAENLNLSQMKKELSVKCRRCKT